MDLRDASHEQAVGLFGKAGNPVVFLVQSIINRPRVFKTKGKVEDSTAFNLDSDTSRAKLLLGPEIKPEISET